MYIWMIIFALTTLPGLVRNFSSARAHLAPKMMLVLLAALAFSGLSILWSPSDKALEMFVGLASMGFCGFIAALYVLTADQEILRRCGVYFAAGYMFGLVFLCVELFLNFPFAHLANPISNIAPIGENTLKRMAALFALGLWPFALFLETHFGKKRWAVLAALVFFILCAFMTSRSALMGVLIGSVVMFFSFYQAALARWVLMTFIAFGIIFTPPLCAVLPLAPPEITGRFFDSAQHRMKIWALTAQHIVAAPLFGNGLDSARGIQTAVHAEATNYMPEGTSIISQHPHNIFLQMWLDGGLIGALLWGGLLLYLADRTRFLPLQAQPYALAAFYCSLAMLNTTFSILQAWWLGGHMAVGIALLALSLNTTKTGNDRPI
jgi:O-antigen ligase